MYIDNRKRFWFPSRQIASFVILFLLASCELGKVQIGYYEVNPTITDSQNSNSVRLPSLSLNAQSISLNIHSAQSFQFQALDGESPFHYSIVSGTGNINSSTGIFEAGTKVEDTTIQVRDSGGRTGTAVVHHYYTPVKGNVKAIEMDSQGNKYLGGDFTGSYPFVSKGLISINSTTGAPNLELDILNGFNGAIRAMVRGSDGSLYIGGSFTMYKDKYVNKIAKLDRFGVLDSVFSPNDASGGFTGGDVKTLVLDPTGNYLYVGGSFYNYRNVSNAARNIAKLSTTDGNLDTSFHPSDSSGGFNSSVNALVLNSTGTTIYAGGYFTSYRGVSNAARNIAKLSTSDGAIDATFHPVDSNGGFNSFVNALALNQTGTTLYVGGLFSAYRGVANSARGIAKLSTIDGAIDTTFHPVSASGGFNSQSVMALALNSAGTILYVGGSFNTYRGVANSANKIAKLSTSDGAIDTTFHPASATGGFNINAPNVIFLNSTNTTLYIGGGFTKYRGVVNSANRIAKLSASDGAIDTTFYPVNLAGGFDSQVYALAFNSSESELYVGGEFTTYRGENSANRIAKIAPNGAIDTSFHPNSSSGGFSYNASPYDDSNSSVLALKLNSTGTTLYVGGEFTAYRNVTNSARFIAKLSTSDGAIDTSFHPVSASGGFSNPVRVLTLNAAGTELYVGGYFSTYRGVTNSAGRIAKLSTSNGAIDTTFHPINASGGFNINTYVFALALDPSESFIYAGGSFTTYRGVANSARGIAKLSTSDGAIDTTFHPIDAAGGFSTQNVSALALNSTGTILYAGGSFTSYRGVANSARYIAKLSTSDGAIDTSFHPADASGGFNTNTNTLTLSQDENSLYVGGGFTTYRGVANSARYIAKLSVSDGAIDSTFHPVDANSGFSGAGTVTIYSLFKDPASNELHVGGTQKYYQGNLSLSFTTIHKTNGTLFNPE